MGVAITRTTLAGGAVLAVIRESVDAGAETGHPVLSERDLARSLEDTLSAWDGGSGVGLVGCGSLSWNLERAVAQTAPEHRSGRARPNRGQARPSLASVRPAATADRATTTARLCCPGRLAPKPRTSFHAKVLPWRRSRRKPPTHFVNAMLSSKPCFALSMAAPDRTIWP